MVSCLAGRGQRGSFKVGAAKHLSSIDHHRNSCAPLLLKVQHQMNLKMFYLIIIVVHPSVQQGSLVLPCIKRISRKQQVHPSAWNPKQMFWRGISTKMHLLFVPMMTRTKGLLCCIHPRFAHLALCLQSPGTLGFSFLKVIGIVHISLSFVTSQRVCFTTHPLRKGGQPSAASDGIFFRVRGVRRQAADTC